MTKAYGLEVIDPRNVSGGRTTAWFPGDLTLGFYKHDSLQYWNIITARAVLEEPRVIFEGVREFNTGGWCYVGRPEEWYIRPSVKHPFPDHLVYSVYLNPAMFVYHFRADEADLARPDYPLGWSKRYKGQIWPTIS